MALNTLTSDQQAKLTRIIKEGVSEYQKIEDIKVSLKDLVKVVSEELNVKPKELNKAIRLAYKNSLKDETDEFETVSEILVVSGFAVNDN